MNYDARMDSLAAVDALSALSGLADMDALYSRAARAAVDKGESFVGSCNDSWMSGLSVNLAVILSMASHSNLY